MQSSISSFFWKAVYITLYHCWTKRDVLSLTFELRFKTWWSFCWSCFSWYHWEKKYLWIQSYNVFSQHNNKLSFGLLQQLADEIDLQIIRNYDAAGAIDRTTSEKRFEKDHCYLLSIIAICYLLSVKPLLIIFCKETNNSVSPTFQQQKRWQLKDEKHMGR